jgi:hypothetical protein
VVLTMCSMDPKGSAISSLGICGYISVIAALKFTYFLIKGLMFFFKNNQGTSLIGNVFILYDY